MAVIQKVGLGESTSSSSQSSGAFTTQNTTAGNTIIVPIVTWDGTNRRTISTIGDTQNTYNLLKHHQVDNGSEKLDIWLYWAIGIVGGNKNAITVTLNAAAAEFEVGAMECDPVNTIDQQNLNNGSGTPITPGSITTLQANTLVVDLKNSDNVVTWGTPTNYTNQFQDTGSTFQASQTNTRVLSSTSTENPSSTATGAGVWCAMIVSLYQASGGPYGVLPHYRTRRTEPKPGEFYDLREPNRRFDKWRADQLRRQAA